MPFVVQQGADYTVGDQPMRILIRRGTEVQTVSPGDFVSEQALEDLLAGTPDLLGADREGPIAFVHRQVNLDEPGILDLLFVTSDGLPIAVEVKLARNAQARREVVAQAIDYLSSLTALTVDELDERVGGRLENALRTFAGEDDSAFDRAWLAVAANLRAGLARLVIALDEAPSGLERIFRFLARNSQLDVQLLTVQRYQSPDSGEVFVPRHVLQVGSDDRVGGAASGRAPRAELAAVVDAWNTGAAPEDEAVGTALNYRQVRVPAWRGMGTHYEFTQARDQVGAELHIESDRARGLSEILAPLNGKAVASGQGTLKWDSSWSSGRGRLQALFPLTAPAQTIAQAMSDLIALTRSPVTERLKTLS
jgi:hypothetical protein